MAEGTAAPARRKRSAPRKTDTARVGSDTLDVLGLSGKAMVLRRMLTPHQEARAELEALMQIHNLGPDDLIPGWPASPEGVPTFKARIEAAEKAEKEILDSFTPKVVARLREILEREEAMS